MGRPGPSRRGGRRARSCTASSRLPPRSEGASRPSRGTMGPTSRVKNPLYRSDHESILQYILERKRRVSDRRPSIFFLKDGACVPVNKPEHEPPHRGHKPWLPQRPLRSFERLTIGCRPRGAPHPAPLPAPRCEGERRIVVPRRSPRRWPPSPSPRRGEGARRADEGRPPPASGARATQNVRRSRAVNDRMASSVAASSRSGREAGTDGPTGVGQAFRPDPARSDGSGLNHGWHGSHGSTGPNRPSRLPSV